MMMRDTSGFYLVAALMLLVGVHATEELTSTTFKEVTTSGKNGMIKFFQPWCGHCTRMKPAWDEVAEKAHPSVFIADVNCSDEDELCSQNDVSGYPTIKVYKDGKVENYKGGRDVDALMDFVDSELAMKCSVDDAEETCSEKETKYIGKWKAKEPADIAKELSRLKGMADKSMTADLKQWLKERMSVLSQLAPKDENTEEL